MTKPSYDRRDFMKIAGLSFGTLALSTVITQPAAFAKEIYPRGKITLIVPNKPGGGYDIFARVISPYMTKYMKNLSPGVTGGDIIVKN